MAESINLGVGTTMVLENPAFAGLLWKMSPASFAVRMSEGRWIPFNYLQLLSRKLVDVAMGRCKRLIVTMPPRHGKSEVVSKYFPAWFLETFPEKEFVLCSYEAEFASSWGAKVRDIFLQNSEILSLEFDSKNPARHSWKTTKGGGMFCAGAGGPLTGRGADILVIDDPIKNNQEAESLTIRNQLWDWYLTTARTRLHPGGAVVAMMTRWSSDDLIGRLLGDAYYSEKGTRERWEVFNFPAIADPESDLHYASMGAEVNDLRIDVLNDAQAMRELKEDPQWRDILGRKKGDALCPSRYNEEDLSLIRGGSSERTWFSLYQQRPGDEADDGNVYHTFDEKANCRPIVRNQGMRLFCAFDFNVDPMCVAIGQYEPGAGLRQMERIEVLEEVVLPNSNTYSACEVVITQLAAYREGHALYVEIYGDAAGTQRTANSKKTNWQVVSDHFQLHTWLQPKFIRRKDNPNITDRVNAVNAMLKSADGTRRMFVDPQKCRELVRDFLKVCWQVDVSGNTTTGQLDKRDKKRTHISDALGYMVEYLFSLRTRAGGRKGILR